MLFFCIKVNAFETYHPIRDWNLKKKKITFRNWTSVFFNRTKATVPTLRNATHELLL